MRFFAVLILLLCFQVNADNLSDSNRLFDWAEINFPEFFSPSGQETFEADIYLARFYPETGNYVGTAGNDVYVLGDVFGGLLKVGVINDFIPPPLTDRFVLSGNSDGTISVLRKNQLTGLAEPKHYFNASAFGAKDIMYDADNERIFLLTSNELVLLSFNPLNGAIEQLDVRPTAGNSSHMVRLGERIYIASGTSSNQSIDFFTVNSDGILSPPGNFSVNIDPDYIALNPAGTHLYLVSRNDDEIQIFALDANSEPSGNPVSINTGSEPTALVFHNSGSFAYLSRADSSDNIVVYNVGSDASLGQQSTITAGREPVDIVIDADDNNLYTAGSNKRLYQFSIAGDGSLSEVENQSINFSPTDLNLSPTGNQLYISHSEEDLVSTFDVVKSDGTLTLIDWSRVYNSANTVTSVAGEGGLVSNGEFLIVPDDSALQSYSVNAFGALTALAANTDTTASVIGGEVAVDYQNNLLLAAGAVGEFESETDWFATYGINQITGELTSRDQYSPGTGESQPEFNRVEAGRSARFAYILDGGGTTANSVVRVYSYRADGTIDSSEVDSQTVGQGAEELALHPAGQYLYSVNSFGDTINWLRISKSNGTVSSIGTTTPGDKGSGQGRPIDMAFHPNGRYAYVSLEDDSEVVTYTVDDDGSLDNRNATSAGADAGPGPIAVHPRGNFVYVGHRNSNQIGAYAVQSDYSLQLQSSIAASSTPDWIQIDPNGAFILVRYRDESIETFSIDVATSNLSTDGSLVTPNGSAGFISSITLVAPLSVE